MHNRMRTVWTAVREHALDLLYKYECLSCRAELASGCDVVALCKDCLAEMPVVDWPVCLRCAAEVPKHPGTVPTCSRCDADKLRFDAAFSLGHYDGLLRELILRMKIDRQEQWGQVFAQLICDRYGAVLGDIPVDAIVPIPMTPWRRWMRGTNAPAVIARTLGEILRIPVLEGLVKRTFQAVPQRGLSRAGRFRNVRGGYRIGQGYCLDAPHILLVDDVMTTGATCNEVAKLLKRSGAARVTVLVVARTPNN
jgi:ComF family protein